jgi:nucleoside-diphosphate-sugar epimerase
MTKKHLIIGATGAIGHAFATALQEAGEKATLLVRDRKKAADLFGDAAGFTIVEGNANDAVLLKKVSEGAEYIFHGANVSYERWAKAMPVITRNVIDAAEHSGATVIFPGNNHNYGPIDQPISEFTPFNPSTSLGKVRVELERMLQRASDQGRIRTLVVRMAEVWGPNVTNKQFATVFGNAIKGKPMHWLISVEPAQQLLYAPDAGRAMVAMTQRGERKDYEVVNIGGILVPSIQSWLEQIAEGADTPAKIRVVPKLIVSVLGLIVPVMREVASLSYKYETSVILNEAKFRAALPGFKYKPMEEAIAETLAWFKANGSVASDKTQSI